MQRKPSSRKDEISEIAKQELTNEDEIVPSQNGLKKLVTYEDDDLSIEELPDKAGNKKKKSAPKRKGRSKSPKKSKSRSKSPKGKKSKSPPKGKKSKSPPKGKKPKGGSPKRKKSKKGAGTVLDKEGPKFLD